jgi:hypothetical protein
MSPLLLCFVSVNRIVDFYFFWGGGVIFQSFGNITPNYNTALMGNSDSLYCLQERKLFVRVGTAFLASPLTDLYLL